MTPSERVLVMVKNTLSIVGSLGVNLSQNQNPALKWFAKHPKGRMSAPHHWGCAKLHWGLIVCQATGLKLFNFLGLCCSASTGELQWLFLSWTQKEIPLSSAFGFHVNLDRGTEVMKPSTASLKFANSRTRRSLQSSRANSEPHRKTKLSS